MAAIDLERFFPTFFAESATGLDMMEADLLRLERDTGDVETMNAIFRAVHSIKGTSSTFGFGDLANFTHALESFLDKMRNGQLKATAAIVNVLLKAVDALRAMLAAAQRRDTLSADGAELNAKILALLQTEHQTAPTTIPGAKAGAAHAHYRIEFRPHADLYKTGNDPLRLFQVLAGMGRLKVEADTSALPAFDALDPENAYIAWRLDLEAPVTRAQILEVFEWVADDCHLEIDELSAPAEAPALPALTLSSDAPTTNATGNLLHVSTEKVDHLINLVGELVITQTMLKQVGDDFTLDRVTQLQAALAQLERNTRELQQNVMSIRMLPASFAFNRFARMVRDTSQQLGKRVELKISGEQSELDKTVIEKLIDPLTHLIRNSLDHGIEPPDVRRRLGKPEVATIAMHAEHKGGNIVIKISDDGQGLNRERIRQKAAAKGLIAADAVLSEQEIDQLIFLPGFSTADVVSDVSGRGVGMDVVRRNIASLGGSIDIDSLSGVGITFTIRLPLTLAIVDGLSLALGDETYIMPLTFILESIQAQPEQLRSVAGVGHVVEVRGEYLPVIDLHHLLQTGSSSPLHEGILVLLEADGKQVALRVDALLGQDQVVIKSLEANFRKVPFISGATILGDGHVALILDANAIARSV